MRITCRIDHPCTETPTTQYPAIHVELRVSFPTYASTEEVESAMHEALAKVRADLEERP